MRKSLVSLLIACVCAIGTAWAERVSQEDAATVANHFMNVQPARTGAKYAPAKRMVLMANGERTNGESSEPQYYIYQNANGEGWVIIAANDVVRPVLAYSPTGQFRTDNMPRNVKGWLQGYDKQIKFMAARRTEASEEVQREWTRLRSSARATTATPVVAPLIETGWDQVAPYWNMCPTKGSQNCAVGCVATAMAQVMNYWRWPRKGTGSHSITYNNKTYTADFGNTTYDWDNMLNHYGSSATDEQKNAVATLMYHCGVAVDMQYGTASEGGSAAYSIDYDGYHSSQGDMCAETALKQFFNYHSSTVKGYDRAGYVGYKTWTKAKWQNMLKNELDAGRPIMYAGVGCDDPNDDNTCYGHSFICDGYDTDDYFHFNFGWSNYCDGYYDVDAIETTDPGTGGGNGEYNYQQDVIIGIQPSVIGHIIETNATGCTITTHAVAVENGQPVTATITPADETYVFTSLSVTLGNAVLVEGTDYTVSADHKTLNISASAITGDISNDLVITAVWTKASYKYEISAARCTYPESGTLPMTGVPLELTFLPETGYTLSQPTCWQVLMGSDTLDYGVGFTYNDSTGAFHIPSVTNDVQIAVTGGKPVVWTAVGEPFATTYTTYNFAYMADVVILPEGTPQACDDGREFVGWTTQEYENTSIAPLFVQDGNLCITNTYYAVFARAQEGGEADFDGVTDGEYRIYAKVGNTKHYATGTVANNRFESTTNEEDATTFEIIRVDEDGYTIQIGAEYLTYTSGGSSGISMQSTPYVWTISQGTYGSWHVQGSTSQARALIFRAGDYYRFSSYNSTYLDGSEYFDLEIVGNHGIVYDYYSTSCTGEVPPPAPVYYAVRFFDRGEQIGETEYVLKNSQALVPANPEGCGDYEFVGWWTTELPVTNMEAKEWITDFTITKRQNFFAIYRCTDESGGNFDGSKGGKFLIYAQVGDTKYYALGSGQKLTSTTEETLADEYIFEKQSGGFAIKAGGLYITYASGSSLGISETPYIWIFTQGVKGTWRVEAQMRGRAMIFRAGDYFVFRGYQTSSVTASGTEYYDLEIGATPTKTYYTSSPACDGPQGIDDINANTGSGASVLKLLRDGRIVIIRGENEYTITGIRMR